MYFCSHCSTLWFICSWCSMSCMREWGLGFQKRSLNFLVRRNQLWWITLYPAPKIMSRQKRCWSSYSQFWMSRQRCLSSRCGGCLYLRSKKSNQDYQEEPRREAKPLTLYDLFWFTLLINCDLTCKLILYYKWKNLFLVRLNWWLLFSPLLL